MGAARTLVERPARLLLLGGQLALAFMTVTICYDAIMRYVLAAPTSWSLEINTFLIVYLAAMTAADAQRVDGHIRIDFFTDRMAPAAARWVAVAVHLVGAGFAGIMAWRGGMMTWQAWEYGERVSSSFGTPMWIAYAMLPLGFGMLTLVFLINASDAARGRVVAKVSSDVV